MHSHTDSAWGGWGGGGYTIGGGGGVGEPRTGIISTRANSADVLIIRRMIPTNIETATVVLTDFLS